jgi:hypothetical protein
MLKKHGKLFSSCIETNHMHLMSRVVSENQLNLTNHGEYSFSRLLPHIYFKEIQISGGKVI